MSCFLPYFQIFVSILRFTFIDYFLSNFDIERTSDIISVDLPRQEILAKRYLIYGSGSLNNAYSDAKDIVYGINSGKGFFSVGILTENEASKLKS